MDVATLVNQNPAIRAPCDLHSDKVFQFAKVFQLEISGQLRLHSSNISSILASNK